MCGVFCDFARFRKRTENRRGFDFSHVIVMLNDDCSLFVALPQRTLHLFICRYILHAIHNTLTLPPGEKRAYLEV